MSKRMLRTILIDANARKVEEIELQDDLDAFYELIGCRCIDIIRRPVGDKWFEIMIDDEGLLIDDPIPSAVSVDKKVQEVLVGNLMLFNVNDEGDLVSLSDDDIRLIRDHVCVFHDVRHKTVRPMLKIWGGEGNDRMGN